MFNLNAFTPTLLLTFAGLLIVILAALLLRFRRRSSAQRAQNPPLTIRQRLMGGLKLLGFGLLILALIVSTLVIVETYRTMLAETATAFRPVEIPPDTALPLQEITFTGGDGIQLAGWYVPPTNNVVIILLHGFSGTRADTLGYAEPLVAAGYGVLMYDERGSGESGGDHRSYGWEDGPDVTGAIHFIRQQPTGQSARIGIGGCSMGAQIALQGAVQNAEILAVWADGASTIRAVDNAPPHNLLSGVIVTTQYLLDWMYEMRLDLTAPPPMLEQIPLIAPRPIMLVGGGTEVGLLGSESPRIQRFGEVAGPNAQVWIIPEATHCDGLALRPEEYTARLVRFFDAAFGIDRFSSPCPPPERERAREK